MNNKKITLSWLLAALSIPASAEMKWVEQPVIQKLALSSEKSAALNVTRERVTFNQNLIGQAHHEFQNQGFNTESKQYWIDSDATQLAQGINLPLSSETAIIRINPLQKTTKIQAIEEQQIELSMAGDQLTPQTFVNGQQLKATGMSVSEETVALKVMAQAGNLNLKVNDLVDKDGKYVIHVFEPESNHILALKTTQQNYTNGADVTIKVHMNDAAGSVPMKVNGYVTGPNGEKAHNLTFKTGREGDYQAVLSEIQGQSMINGLWEVHTFTEATVNGQKILRDASTAFAVNLASAQFNGQLEAAQGRLVLGIENISAARYEISGTLMGYDNKGNKKPIALMMAAQWLEAGQTSLSFDWPNELIKASGYQAPFVISGVALKNQSLMAPVQRVEQGIMLSELPAELSDKK